MACLSFDAVARSGLFFSFCAAWRVACRGVVALTGLHFVAVAESVQKYATAFAENEIALNQLAELDHDLLKVRPVGTCVNVFLGLCSVLCARDALLANNKKNDLSEQVALQARSTVC